MKKLIFACKGLFCCKFFGIKKLFSKKCNSLHFFKKLAAFSLVELMISLITISCIAAAFTPVITKKLKKQDVALSLAQTSEIKSPCPEFGDDCKLCTKAYCVTCEKSCSTGQYAESKTCTCKSCSEHDKIKNSPLASECVSCNNDGCNACNNEGNKEGLYYIIDEKGENTHICNACGDASKYYCDGIKRYDKSQCSAPENSGYVCINGIKQPCSLIYGNTCSTCNPTKCLTCAAYYHLNSKGICVSCPGGCMTCNACNRQDTCNTCEKCYASYYLLNNQCVACTTGSSKIDNCEFCTGGNYYGTSVANPNKCETCKAGYVLNSAKTACSACNIPNCYSCKDKVSPLKCDNCNGGYFVNSSGTCTTCTSKFGSDCLSCNLSQCLSCAQGKHLGSNPSSTEPCTSDAGQWKCSDSNFMRIGDLCVTRRNMGDSNLLKSRFPVDIRVVNNDEYCYANVEKCCWGGNTANTNGCNAINGSYSGCSRTVCNFEAAKAICENFNYLGLNWRLPTQEEMSLFQSKTSGLGDNGLQLCRESPGNDNVVASQCNRGTCRGTSTSGCRLYGLWFGNHGLFSYLGLWEAIECNNCYSNEAAGVRCVTILPAQYK